MSFTEFIRGKYDIENKEYINTLLKNMTLKEQALIASEPFEVLWKMVFGDDRTSPDFIMYKDRFNKLDRIALMKKNLSDYTEPEWGFPKGRRMRGETDVACAIREFDEETNIPRDSYLVLKNMILEESFVGLNGVKYKHIYFVAVLKHPEMLDLSQRFTTMQRREISAIAWKSMDQAEALIRPHHLERSGMLQQLKTIIETFEIE
jgi:8-oxo-dGTP pyrophosphatase MutT (NUDIX family)